MLVVLAVVYCNTKQIKINKNPISVVLFLEGLDRGMDRHLVDCVGRLIFTRSINFPFPCGCF